MRTVATKLSPDAIKSEATRLGIVWSEATGLLIHSFEDGSAALVVHRVSPVRRRGRLAIAHRRVIEHSPPGIVRAASPRESPRADRRLRAQGPRFGVPRVNDAEALRASTSFAHQAPPVPRRSIGGRRSAPSPRAREPRRRAKAFAPAPEAALAAVAGEKDRASGRYGPDRLPNEGHAATNAPRNRSNSAAARVAGANARVAAGVSPSPRYASSQSVAFAPSSPGGASSYL
jgi:hypothetical protein